MNVAILFSINSIVAIVTKVLLKLRSKMLSQNSIAKYSLLLLINGLIACLFFSISNGFRIKLNTATFFYSLIYAFVVIASIVSNVIVYRYASVSNVSIVSSSCSMLCTVFIGYTFLSEKYEGKTLVRLAVMLVAMLFVFLDLKQKNTSSDSDQDTSQKKNDLIPLISVIAVITLTGCANTVVLKLFASSKNVTDENSFFFFTNVILCILMVTVFFIAVLRKKGEFRDSILLLTPKNLITIAGSTVCSNISSIISAWIIAILPVSVYSPISSAIGIIVSAIASLIFREKMRAFSYIAVAIACIAVII